ncbi:MAG: hypothetical protein KAG53_01630 [Endozoicomonadaceae bacterium]|nr:hypothetical protein [Endozoicomonadaceae bacterium]
MALPSSSPTNNNDTIDEKQASSQYHTEMEELLQAMINEKYDNSLINTHIGDSFIRMATLEKEENNGLQSNAIASIFNLLGNIDDHLLFNVPKLSNRQQWIRAQTKKIMINLENKAIPLLDKAFVYALDIDNTIVASNIKLKNWSKQFWSDTLEYCNKKTPFNREFVVDNDRLHYVLKDL